jgi:hypothetical protein
MKPGEGVLILTPKGMEELRNRESRMDVTARNILSLIDQGANTANAILQRSMFPQKAVMEGLRQLLSNRLVATDDGGRTSDAKSSAASGSRSLRLEFGISISLARFALSDFCLDQFGAKGQELVEVVGLCTDVIGLQDVLNDIRAEVEARFPDRLPALLACVREINETAA